MVAKGMARDISKGVVPAAHIRAEVMGRVFTDKETRDVLAPEYIKHTTAKVARFFDVGSDTGRRFVEILNTMPVLNEAERRDVETLELVLLHMSESAKSTSDILGRARTSPANIVNLKTIEGGRHE
jgi:hypothetical protein